jgi:hypothetical protein
MGGLINAYRNLDEEPGGRKPIGKLVFNGRLMLKWILKK